MKNKNFVFSAILLFGFGLTGLQAQLAQVSPVLKGDYLGQPLPGETPVVFARGIVSTDDKEHWAPRFSPDGNEVFWWSIRQGHDDQWLDFHTTIRRVEDQWTAPEKSPFDRAPIFSPDGKRLYFGSQKEGEDLTFVEKQGSGWSEPKSAGLVTRFPEVRFVYFPSITRDGTIYFMGYHEGQWMNLGIYRAELINGEYAKPVLLPPSINTLEGVRNWTSYVAPDESYLIFCSTRGLPASDQGDLFVCFRQSDGNWTAPVSMGAPINSKELERFPAVSPDGKYLFFTRDTPGYDEDVYWASAGIIEKLKAQAIREKRLKQRDEQTRYTKQNLPPSSKHARERIDRLMRSYDKNGQFNGTILVIQNNKVLYKRAFGLADRQWNIENTLDSKFLIGSISKSYTALMILILVNEGFIDLNATINTYIPQYEGPGKNRATIHQMLTHTSGIPNHGAIPNLFKKRVRWNYDSDQYLELVKETELKFEPGTGFEYSGIAYNLLAISCEKVTKKSFGELLKQRIFVPLHMNDTSLNTNLDIDSKRANGYEYYLLDGYKLPSYVSMDHCKGSGGILSTVEDMAKFNAECFDARTLTAKSLYEKMFTPYVKDWQYYGYGWWIDTIDRNGSKRTLISHGGSTDGYKAYSTRIVEDRTDIIILENDYFRTDVGVKWCYDITDEIIDILAGKEIEEPKKSIASAVGLTIGQAGIDKALAQLSALKKNDEYQIRAADYYYLASELDKKHNLKQESIKIFQEGLKDFPDDFRLNYYFAETLAGIDDKKAIELYQKSIRLYTSDEANKRYSEEYKKALNAVSANAG